MSERSSDPFAATAVAGSDATAATTTAGDDRPRDSFVMLEVGQRLGDRYDILGYLGEGGMGAVYRAFDAVLGEEVALKVVRGAYAGDAALREEVRIAQKVTHENVCRTYDLEEVAGYQLVKMEYIAGETLAARIAAHGPLATDEAVRIARAIAAGLEAAHARGIVHRDLKPGNVMLEKQRVVLMDFGLARHVTDEALERAGTPGYMSPEQLAGERVTPASDLFALGCLLYEMLAGARAFAHGTMTEVAVRRAAEAAPDVIVKRPTTPRWLVRATQLLMSKTAGPRADGLALLASGPKRPRWVVPVIVLGVGILLGNAWYIYQALRPDAPKPWTPNIVDVPIEFGQGSIDRIALSPDGKTLALIVDRTGDETGFIHTVPFPEGGTATPWPTQPLHPVGGFRWRDAKSFVVGVADPAGPQVGVLDDTGFHPWGSGSDPVVCLGGLVAVVHSEQTHGDTLVVYAAPGATGEVLVPSDQPLDFPRCDPSGTRLVLSQYLPPGLVLVENKTARALTTEVDQTAAFTRDGKSIVFSRRNGDNAVIHVRGVDGIAASVPITPNRGLAFVMEPSPVDDNILAFLHSEPRVAILRHGRSSSVITEDARDVRDIIAAPNNAVVGVWLNTVVYFDEVGRRTNLEDGALPVVIDARVYFRRGVDEVWSMPLDRSAPAALVAKLPGRIVARAAGPDGPHFEVIVDQAQRSFRIDPDGTVRDDGHAGLGIPAPRGPWRAIYTRGAASFQAAGQLTHTLPCTEPPAWMDEHHAACITAGRPPTLTQIDVRDGKRVELDRWGERDYERVAGSDGHWLVLRGILHGQVKVITNFAARPR